MSTRIKSYNHAFDLEFEVSGSAYADPDDSMQYEMMRIVDALDEAVQEIKKDPRTLYKYLSPYSYASYEEED